MTQDAISSEAQVELRDRFRGVLLGLAVGDALGGPLEFQPAREPANYLRDMTGGGWQQLQPGEWTDDTQMTLCTVESLLAKRVFDPDDIASRFVDWMETKPKDIGTHTAKILHAIQKGNHWEAATKEAYLADPENAPNGSLMRSAPLALFFYRQPDFVATLSPVLSRITHAHPDCEFASVFLNVAIASLLLGDRTQKAIDTAYEAISDSSKELRARIDNATHPDCKTLPTGWVLDTLEVALWAFLHTRSYEEAVVTVVNLGSDSDTVGAILGALAGACYGYSAIPERWLAPLKEHDKLLAYADELFDLANE